MKRKNPNPTTAEKHFCSGKYFIEMPEIPILCLGRTETPPKWVKQTELWWAAPTHRGTLTQSDPQRKGKQHFLHPPTPAAPDFSILRPGGALCKPSEGSAPASPVPVPWALTQDLCQPKQFLRQESAAAIALCWILTHGQKPNASNFQACSVVVARVCLLFRMTSPKHGNKMRNCSKSWISLLMTRQKWHCSAMCAQLSTCVTLSISAQDKPTYRQGKKMQLALTFQPGLSSADPAREGNVPTRKSWAPWTQLLKVKQPCSHGLHSVQTVQVHKTSLTTPKPALFLTGHRDVAGPSARSETSSSGFQLNTVNFWLNYRVKEKQTTTS